MARGRLAIPMLLTALLCGGCATMISGTRQSVRVESNAPDATVRVDGEAEAVLLPAVVTLPRRSAALLVEAPDHHAEWVRPARHFNVVTMLNLFAFGLVGILVDAGTGAIFLYPNPIVVHLEPIPSEHIEPVPFRPSPAASSRLEDDADDDLPPPPVLSIPPDEPPAPKVDDRPPEPMEPRPL